MVLPYLSGLERILKRMRTAFDDLEQFSTSKPNSSHQAHLKRNDRRFVASRLAGSSVGQHTNRLSRRRRAPAAALTSRAAWPARWAAPRRDRRARGGAG